MAGWISITATILTGFTLAILYLMTPLQVIMNTLPNMSRASVALKNVEELGLSLTPSSSEAASPKLLTAGQPWAELELRGVTHSYRREGEDSLFVPWERPEHSQMIREIRKIEASGAVELDRFFPGKHLNEDYRSVRSTVVRGNR